MYLGGFEIDIGIDIFVSIFIGATTFRKTPDYSLRLHVMLMLIPLHSTIGYWLTAKRGTLHVQSEVIVHINDDILP